MIEVYNNFISVIVPCLNNEKTIERCIKTLLKQDYPSNSFEIILVDTGSSDKTISIIQKYPVKLFKEKTKNPYIARNVGALHAKGQILAFTDANCEIDKSWISNINSIMNTGADVSQGPGFLTNQKSLLPKAESKRLFMDGNDFWGDAKNLAIKKGVFYKVNGFFEYYTGCDSILLNQLKSLNYNIKYNKNQLVYRVFPEKLNILIKKSWKYGKGDIVVDYFRDDLKRFRMVRRMTITLNKRLLIKLMKSKKYEDLLMDIYSYLIWEIRYFSYFLNYHSTLKEINELKSNHKNIFYEKIDFIG